MNIAHADEGQPTTTGCENEPLRTRPIKPSETLDCSNDNDGHQKKQSLILALTSSRDFLNEDNQNGYWGYMTMQGFSIYELIWESLPRSHEQKVNRKSIPHCSTRSETVLLKLNPKSLPFRNLLYLFLPKMVGSTQA